MVAQLIAVYPQGGQVASACKPPRKHSPV